MYGSRPGTYVSTEHELLRGKKRKEKKEEKGGKKEKRKRERERIKINKK